MKPTLETSPLLQRIARAIEQHQSSAKRLHISVARESKWERSKLSSNEILVRWLCWSLESATEEIVPPEFEVLHPDVTEERLRRELPDFFPALEIVVDNAIEV